MMVGLSMIEVVVKERVVLIVKVITATFGAKIMDVVNT